LLNVGPRLDNPISRHRVWFLGATLDPALPRPIIKKMTKHGVLDLQPMSVKDVRDPSLTGLKPRQIARKIKARVKRWLWKHNVAMTLMARDRMLMLDPDWSRRRSVKNLKKSAKKLATDNRFFRLVHVRRQPAVGAKDWRPTPARQPDFEQRYWSDWKSFSQNLNSLAPGDATAASKASAEMGPTLHIKGAAMPVPVVAAIETNLRHRTCEVDPRRGHVPLRCRRAACSAFL